jgi:hypothetical protein
MAMGQNAQIDFLCKSIALAFWKSSRT